MEVVEMTTATATRVSREILDERWRAAVTQPQPMRDPDGSHSTNLDNSKDFYEWEEAVVMIATRLRGDHLHADEQEQVEHIAATLWDGALRSALLEWAGEHAV